VEGIAEPMKRGAGPPGPRRLAGPVAAPAPTPAAPDTLPADTTGAASDSVALYSVRWLDVDSIAPLLPYPVATYLVRQRPAPGVPDLPRRNPRPLHDESMHLTYAVQWFLFAILIPAGTAALAWSRRRRAARRPSPEATP
jgi:cytochrome oxidase assembly protein ShyY1